jgi:hypothetical protein
MIYSQFIKPKKSWFIEHLRSNCTSLKCSGIPIQKGRFLAYLSSDILNQKILILLLINSPSQYIRQERQRDGQQSCVLDVVIFANRDTFNALEPTPLTRYQNRWLGKHRIKSRTLKIFQSFWLMSCQLINRDEKP